MGELTLWVPDETAPTGRRLAAAPEVVGWLRSEGAGEQVEWCEPHRNEAWEDYQGSDDNLVFTGYRCPHGAWIEGANAWDCRIVPILVVRIDGGVGTGEKE